jgi:O-methyltransferase
MTEAALPEVAGVPRTMLITVSARAMASSERPDMGFRDPYAEHIIGLLGIDPREYCTFVGSLVATIYRSMFFDRMTRAFFERHPTGVGINLACGLGTNYERIAGAGFPRITWLDVDLPEVTAIRRRFFTDTETRRTVEGDITNPSLFGDLLSLAAGRPTLILMEGLLYYLDSLQVQAIFERLAAANDVHGGECELGFDVASPSGVLLSNARNTDTQRTETVFRWGCSGTSELMLWDPRLELVETGDHGAFVPAEIQPLFAAAKARDGIAPFAVFHLRRSPEHAHP